LTDNGIFSIESGVSRFITDLIEGDISTQLWSLKPRAGSLVQPHLCFSSKMSAKMSYGAQHTEERRFMFGVAGSNRSTKLADIRIRFDLCPGEDDDRAPIVDPALTLEYPDAISHNSVENVLDIFFEEMHLRIKRKGDGFEYSIGATGGKSLHPIYKTQFVQTLVISMLIDWQKTATTALAEVASLSELEESEQAQGRSFIGLLRTTVSAYRVAYASVALDHDSEYLDSGDAQAVQELKKKAKQLSSVHPVLGGPYELITPRVDVLMSLDSSGQLVERGRDKDARQFDVRTRLGSGENPKIIFRPDISELQFSGPLWNELSSEVFNQADELFADWNRIRKPQEYPLSMSIKRNTFAGLIRKAVTEGNIVFIRLREQVHQDRELIWFRAEHSGDSLEFLYGCDVKVSQYPTISLEMMKDFELLMFRRGEYYFVSDAGSSRKKDHKSLSNLFGPLFNLLLAWFEQASSAPG